MPRSRLRVTRCCGYVTFAADLPTVPVTRYVAAVTARLRYVVSGLFTLHVQLIAGLRLFARYAHVSLRVVRTRYVCALLRLVTAFDFAPAFCGYVCTVAVVTLHWLRCCLPVYTTRSPPFTFFTHVPFGFTFYVVTTFARLRWILFTHGCRSYGWLHLYHTHYTRTDAFTLHYVDYRLRWTRIYGCRFPLQLDFTHVYVWFILDLRSLLRFQFIRVIRCRWLGCYLYACGCYVTFTLRCTFVTSFPIHVCLFVGYYVDLLPVGLLITPHVHHVRLRCERSRLLIALPRYALVYVYVYLYVTVYRYALRLRSSVGCTFTFAGYVTCLYVPVYVLRCWLFSRLVYVCV